MPPRDVSSIIFVVDEDAGPPVAMGIRDAGGNAALLIDLLGKRGVPDIEWLPRVKEWGGALVTRDVSMRSGSVERDAFANCGVHVFILRGQGMRFDALRQTMARHFPIMQRAVRSQLLPFVARVTAGGVEVIKTGGRPGGIRRQ